MSKVRPIAFYLPQFYPTPENDEWWEPGFTEWTNVAKAKPLYRGHYQPRIPRDLGFYDLRVPETREKQAQLAREAGIEGFCYWHYWFAGRRLLDRVFTEVVESGKPDFPFCLCWANHSWYKKTWQPDVPDKLLIEQTYPGEQDYIDHFYAMLPAFKDKRYMKVDGKLIFGVFEPNGIPDASLFVKTWNELAKEHGLYGFYFFAVVQGQYALPKEPSCFDVIVYDSVIDAYYQMKYPFIQSRWRSLFKKYLNRGYAVNYKTYMSVVKKMIEKHPSFIPCIDPDFDHSPRSSGKAVCFYGSTPKLWGNLCNEVSLIMDKVRTPHGLLFIKAWNEWGEGNYLEPDLRWSKGYIEEMAKSFCFKQKIT